MFKMRLFGLTLALIAVLSACSGGAAAPAGAGSLKVLAAESFLGDIAQNVAGERIRVETLLPVIVDPHEYQPLPSDLVNIAKSQALIVNGLGYETWLQKTLDNIGGNHLVITATHGLTPAPDPSASKADGDPHMWMDPLNVVGYVENIRDGLTQADPAGRQVYAQNADAYIAKIKELDAWAKTQVSQLPQEKRLLVTNHDALGYFARAYGFKVIGAIIPSVAPDSSPSAQQMASLIDAIKASGAGAIFLDISENQKLAEQIAAETGVKVVTGLYVETLSAPGGPAPTYIDMIRNDVTLIVSALK